MFAELTLERPQHIPQAFSIHDGIMWVAQANTDSGNAWVTAYHHVSGERWRSGGQMVVYGCHGWPLTVDKHPSGYRRVGALITSGVNTWCRFKWLPDTSADKSDGVTVSKIPVPGGWQRITKSGRDYFYRGSTLLFSRPSPGWVQGELVQDNVLLTLRGSPTYSGNPYPNGVLDRITYTRPNGSILKTVDVPAAIGGVDPIGGRKEHEGLWLYGDRLLIGTAVGYKPNYRYQITELMQ